MKSQISNLKSHLCRLIVLFGVLCLCLAAVAGETARDKMARLVGEYNATADGRDRAKVVNRLGKLKTAETCGELSRVMADIAANDCDQRVAAEALDELGDDARRDRDRGCVANAVQQRAGVSGAFGASGAQRPLGSKAEKQRRQLDKALSGT